MCAFEVSHPDSRRRSAQPRIFTLAEANRALPLVRRIVTDIIANYRVLARLLESRRLREQSGDTAGAAAIDEEAQAGVAQLNELIDELQTIGCELKDWEAGLVDFRALHDGEQVYLCWRLGEDRIRYWHGLHAGMAGRQPIDDRFDTPPTSTSSAREPSRPRSSARRR
jgi:hypothetical protein